jgi:hypothetical protein
MVLTIVGGLGLRYILPASLVPSRAELIIALVRLVGLLPGALGGACWCVWSGLNLQVGVRTRRRGEVLFWGFGLAVSALGTVVMGAAALLPVLSALL